jgi:pyruvate dehydrogenase E1 component alpha subunit
MKLRKEKRVAVTICGDGATSKGDFYESMNAAGAAKLPVVFVVNNNKWAISVRREYQTGCETIAQKAIAAGFEGEQVDGNDIIATHYAISKALDKARNGGGPSLIEALSYRLCDHTTADDASRYRSEEEMQENWKKEPIERLKKYMNAQGFWDDEKENALNEECTTKVEEAVKVYLDTPPLEPEKMFDHMYAEIPHDLAKQRLFFTKQLAKKQQQGEE